MSVPLADTAPAFVEMAHRVVWATAATVDPQGRPWTRVLHPIWEWDGEQLIGWVATGPTPTKRAHLAAHPYVSLTYWHPSQDTASAHCDASLHTDDATCTWLWERFVSAPEPVGYGLGWLPALPRFRRTATGAVAGARPAGPGAAGGQGRADPGMAAPGDLTRPPPPGAGWERGG